MVWSDSPSQRQNQHETIHLLKSSMQYSLRGHADIIFYTWCATDLNMSLLTRVNLCCVHFKNTTAFLLFCSTFGLSIVFSVTERSQISLQICLLMERLSNSHIVCYFKYSRFLLDLGLPKCACIQHPCVLFLYWVCMCLCEIHCREFGRWKVNSLALERQENNGFSLPLDPEFLQTIRQLGRRPSLSAITDNIIRKYGTHFLLSATLGGKWSN